MWRRRLGSRTRSVTGNVSSPSPSPSSSASSSASPVAESVEIETIRFQPPSRTRQHVLYVFGLADDVDEDALFDVFVEFGPIFRLAVHDHSDTGRYATVRYYSTRSAKAAQQASPFLICGEWYKATFSLYGVKTRNFGGHLAQSHSFDLLNHYLGFDGWSSEISAIVSVDPHFPNVPTPPDERFPVYHATVKLTLHDYDTTVTGSGFGFVSEAWGPNHHELTHVMVMKALRKMATRRAYLDAFRQLQFAVVGNGKVALIVDRTAAQSLSEQFVSRAFSSAAEATGGKKENESSSSHCPEGAGKDDAPLRSATALPPPAPASSSPGTSDGVDALYEENFQDIFWEDLRDV